MRRCLVTGFSSSLLLFFLKEKRYFSSILFVWKLFLLFRYSQCIYIKINQTSVGIFKINHLSHSGFSRESVCQQYTKNKNKSFTSIGRSICNFNMHMFRSFTMLWLETPVRTRHANKQTEEEKKEEKNMTCQSLWSVYTCVRWKLFLNRNWKAS